MRELLMRFLIEKKPPLSTAKAAFFVCLVHSSICKENPIQYSNQLFLKINLFFLIFMKECILFMP